MRDRDAVWNESLTSDGGDLLWYEYVTKLQVRDCINYAYTKAREAGAEERGLAECLRAHFAVPDSGSPMASTPPVVRNLVRTIEAMQRRLQDLLLEATESDYPPPNEGVAQYFGDGLSFCLYFSFQLTRAAQIHGSLVVEDPLLASDPTELIQNAQTVDELDLARRAIYSNRKIVIVGNVLVQVDRWTAPSVFGPSIDTLIATDWFLSERFLPLRYESRNQVYYEDPVPKSAMSSLVRGPRLLEIGSGSGLILASFARNEPTLSALDAIDISLDAISTSFKNCRQQRQIQGGYIGDLGSYTVGEFRAARIHEAYDVVVCNPPYVPVMASSSREGRHAVATLGTELLVEVVGHCPTLIGSTGELYLLLSNLSVTDFLASLPADYEGTRLAKRTVPFVVESARLDGDPNYLAYLHRLGLRQRRPRRGAPRYEHDVLLYRIRHKEWAR